MQGLFMIGLETLLDTHHARALMGLASPEDALSGHTDHLSLMLQRFRDTAQRYTDDTAEAGQDDTVSNVLNAMVCFVSSPYHS